MQGRHRENKTSMHSISSCQGTSCSNPTALATSRKYDKNPAHYDTFEKFDPFEKSKVKRDAGGYIKGGKQHTKKGVGLVAPDVIVEGATIANVMGTPGGGAQNEFGGSTRLVACMDHEEYDVENRRTNKRLMLANVRARLQEH